MSDKVMNIDTIKKTRTIERLEAMEAIWDSLLYEDGVKTPDWHKDILEERKSNIKNGKAKFVSLNKLKSSHK